MTSAWSAHRLPLIRIAGRLLTSDLDCSPGDSWIRQAMLALAAQPRYSDVEESDISDLAVRWAGSRRTVVDGSYRWHSVPWPAEERGPYDADADADAETDQHCVSRSCCESPCSEPPFIRSPPAGLAVIARPLCVKSSYSAVGTSGPPGAVRWMSDGAVGSCRYEAGTAYRAIDIHASWTTGLLRVRRRVNGVRRRSNACGLPLRASRDRHRAS
ncbi:hypothetical protein M2280_006294 [Prescottella agglutinans]|uniref:Uncharacterized protein n=1 Tax=Prescottella agglutinans TaxID=1644129 RepID=A0ABT6ML42_9NOCA|nr:hypothetical protein [Prescottella agglutinans]